MFTQQTEEAPDFPTRKGKPLYGAYKGSFSRFSLASVKYPCSNIYPFFFNFFRKRKLLTLAFNDESYTCLISLIWTPLIGYAETILRDKKTGCKYAYRQFLPSQFIRLPRTADREITACRTSRRYIHVFFRRGKKDIEIKTKIRGDIARPDIIGFFTASMNNSDWNQLSFCYPQIHNRWPILSWMFASPLKGSLCIHGENEDKHLFQKDSALFFLDMRTGYFPHVTKLSSVTGLDICDGKKIAFKLSCGEEFSDTNNDNSLYVNGKAWPLPPVYITFPYGITGTWVIQDTENMIDLTFKPISDTHRLMQLFFMKANYHTFFGDFEGTITDGNGESLSLHAFCGIGNKQVTRL